MPLKKRYDAVVVGAGPNGLTAAIVLARAGRSVLVVEGREEVGGGARSEALTLPGFTHDVCSAIHPLAAGSPFLATLPLAAHGLTWIHPARPLAHPLDDGSAALLDRSIDTTAALLGEDGPAYRRLIRGPVVNWDRFAREILAPLHWPRDPAALALFAVRALRSGAGLARSAFRGIPARALFAGLAAHSVLPLERPVSAAIGIVLAAAGHSVGWPMPRGGSLRISDALASLLRSLGGEVVTGMPIAALEDLPSARAILLDLTPRQVARVAGSALPAGYRRRLERYRYGPGVFKVDWALDGPIPWRADACAGAGTVHLGGTLEEIAASESAVWAGEHPERPFVLLAQQSLFDATRAPAGKHTGWAYCHVPNGSTEDMTGRIERQVERFAPGFRERIIARHVMNTGAMERYNPNYIGGDITGGTSDLGQLFFRPLLRLVPYSTPNPAIFICSASTPPGGGVHGMSGFHAARAALRRRLGEGRSGTRPY